MTKIQAKFRVGVDIGGTYINAFLAAQGITWGAKPAHVVRSTTVELDAQHVALHQPRSSTGGYPRRRSMGAAGAAAERPAARLRFRDGAGSRTRAGLCRRAGGAAGGAG